MSTAAPHALRTFFDEAGAKGERALAWVRIWFCTLALANLFVIAGAGQKIADGSVKHIFMAVMLVVPLFYSAAVLYWLRRGPDARLITTTALLDGIVAVLVVGASVVWPAENSMGLLRLPHQAVFPLVLCMNGLRLSIRAAWANALVVIPGCLLLLAVEPTYNQRSAGVPTEDLTLFLVLLGVGLLMAVSYIRRTRGLVLEGAERAIQAERARQRLGVYVSPEIADAAMANDSLVPGGERREVAVLFSDLRGFTRYGERLPPERLVAELNAYLDVMLEEIRAEGGVVDKYIGDAIMVVFGIPQARPDDAARAVRAAMRMQAALARHNESRVASGLTPLRQGVGVHFGPCVAGNIGTPERMQYTVIGDAVNLASRLESATKLLEVDLLVSDDAWRQAQPFLTDVELSSRGEITVPGRDASVRVWSS